MKKTRLLFELSFIFVLPIVFLLFFVNLETTYVYDNSGNYQASSRELSLSEINFVNGVKDVHHGVEYVFYTEEEFNQLDFSGKLYYDVRKNNNLSYVNLINNDTQTNYYIFQPLNYYIGSNFYTPVSSLLNQGNWTITLMLRSNYDVNGFYVSSSNFYVPDGYSLVSFLYVPNFWIKEIIDVDEYHYKNPIYEICVQADNYLGFDSSSVVMQLINSYTCLWVLMFLFWHLLYVFLDLFPHLLDRKRYERE